MENRDFKELLKKRIYLYSLDIIKLIDSLDKRDFSSIILGKQLLRSATSIGANIIEAQAGSSKKDFINFMNYALKSANETKFWLGLLRDSEKCNKIIIEKSLKETIEISNILGSILLKLKGRK